MREQLSTSFRQSISELTEPSFQTLSQMSRMISTPFGLIQLIWQRFDHQIVSFKQPSDTLGFGEILKQLDTVPGLEKLCNRPNLAHYLSQGDVSAQLFVLQTIEAAANATPRKDMLDLVVYQADYWLKTTYPIELECFDYIINEVISYYNIKNAKADLLSQLVFWLLNGNTESEPITTKVSQDDLTFIMVCLTARIHELVARAEQQAITEKWPYWDASYSQTAAVPSPFEEQVNFVKMYFGNKQTGYEQVAVGNVDAAVKNAEYQKVQLELFGRYAFLAIIETAARRLNLQEGSSDLQAVQKILNISETCKAKADATCQVSAPEQTVLFDVAVQTDVDYHSLSRALMAYHNISGSLRRAEQIQKHILNEQSYELRVLDDLDGVLMDFKTYLSTLASEQDETATECTSLYRGVAGLFSLLGNAYQRINQLYEHIVMQNQQMQAQTVAEQYQSTTIGQQIENVYQQLNSALIDCQNIYNQYKTAQTLISRLKADNNALEAAIRAQKLLGAKQSLKTFDAQQKTHYAMRECVALKRENAGLKDMISQLRASASAQTRYQRQFLTEILQIDM